MNVDEYPDHHTREPDVAIPVQPDPEREDRPLPNDTEFIDHQFRMWSGSPVYMLDLYGKILAETSANADDRPGESSLAKRWESHLSELANDTEFDAEVEDDPYSRVFATAKGHVADKPDKLAAIIIVERLYKRREATMDTQQQYERPLPDEGHLLAILRMILEQD